MSFPFPPRRLAAAYSAAAGALAFAVILSGCSTTTGHAKAEGAAAAQAATTSDSLAETTWELVSWTDANGSAMAVPGNNGNPPVGLAFLAHKGKDYRVAGFSGCNRYMGNYRLEGGKLSITVPAATRMGCPSEQLAGFETAYLKALGRISTFTLDAAGAPRKMTLNMQEGGVMTFKRGEDAPTRL
ncbi:META domain-containing protein [Bordetella sp. N]|uniref:META domain-containing protein n=1 Tax=Bordetella sp. N TaxID=1746199 RepID=UPI00070E4613|nr:META domain-containing protein [Bordetella sp. N]ALM85851.1 hypothetical protein ASB57_25475 [Bordetella sp. N]